MVECAVSCCKELSRESAVAGCKTRSTTMPLNHGQRRCGVSHTSVIVLPMFVAIPLETDGLTISNVHPRSASITRRTLTGIFYLYLLMELLDCNIIYEHNQEVVS